MCYSFTGKFKLIGGGTKNTYFFISTLCFQNDYADFTYSLSSPFICIIVGCRYQLKTNTGEVHLIRKQDYPQFQYCSWLFTVDNLNVVKLRFKGNLVFPDCHQSFLKIYDGTSTGAPLIATICGATAVRNTSVLSTRNTLLLVLNAGSYSQRQDSLPEFHVEYNAWSKPGRIPFIPMTTNDIT